MINPLPLLLSQPLPFSEEHDTAMECMLVLAADLMAFVYTNTRENVLHIPTKDVSGWVQDGKRWAWLVGVVIL